MDPFPDKYSLTDAIRDWPRVLQALRFTEQLRNIDVIQNGGKVRRIQVTPKSINAVLDLRSTVASGIYTPVPRAPVTSSGMELWLKADIINQADGSAVTRWLDSSGKDRHYTPSSVSTPTLRLNALNGKPAVVSTGSTQRMANVTGLTFTVATVFCVVKRTNIDANLEMLVWGNASGSNISIGLSFNTSYGPLMVINQEAGDYYKAGTLNLPNEDFRQFTFRYDGVGLHAAGSHRIWRDGSLLALVAQDGFIPDARSGGSIFGNSQAELCELIVYSRALSEAERQETEDYLFSKYSIAGAGEEPAEYGDPNDPENAEPSECEACIDTILVDEVTGQVLTDDVKKKVLTNT